MTNLTCLYQFPLYDQLNLELKSYFCSNLTSESIVDLSSYLSKAFGELRVADSAEIQPGPAYENLNMQNRTIVTSLCHQL